MPTSPVRGRWTAVLRTSTLVALAFSPLACSDSSADPPPTADVTTSTTKATTTTPATTTTTVALSPEEEVEAAYLAIVDRYYAAFMSPDPQAGTISKDFSGAAFEATKQTATDLQGRHQRFTFPGGERPIPSVVSIEMDGSRATVRNCIVDDGVLVDDEEGVLDNSVSSSLLETLLIHQASRWKIDSQSEIQKWEDGKGCDR